MSREIPPDSGADEYSTSTSTRPRSPSQLSSNSSRSSTENGSNRSSSRNGTSRNGNGAPPRKRGRFWRVSGIIAALVVVAGFAYGTLTKNGRAIVKALPDATRTMIAVKQNPNLIFDEANSDTVNILLIGRDVNWKPGKVYDPRTKTYRPFHVIDKTSTARSDSMIVMSLNKEKGTLRLVSLPRDAMVHLPPNEYHVRRAKLNAAHAYGGPELLVKTLHDELGLTIQHYAVIKFDGFKNLIDEVGGVEINVEGALKRNPETGKLYRGDLDYDDNWGGLHQHLKPGMQTLDGKQAHDYVRFREDLEGDTGRMRRQQQVMRALAKKVMRASPLQIPGLIGELRRQFDTDLTDEQLASAAYFTHGLSDTAKVQPITLFGVYSRRGSLTLNRPKNEKLLTAVFGPTFNKENFLVDSPSTDEDEIGAANDSNVGAQEVLREAGLLKDKPAADAPKDDDDTSPQGRAAPTSTSATASMENGTALHSADLQRDNRSGTRSREERAVPKSENGNSASSSNGIVANGTADNTRRDENKISSRRSSFEESSDSSRQLNSSRADSASAEPRHRRRVSSQSNASENRADTSSTRNASSRSDSGNSDSSNADSSNARETRAERRRASLRATSAETSTSRRRARHRRLSREASGREASGHAVSGDAASGNATSDSETPKRASSSNGNSSNESPIPVAENSSASKGSRDNQRDSSRDESPIPRAE